MRRRIVVVSWALAALLGGALLPASQAAGGLKLRAQAPLYTDSKGAALTEPEGVAFGPESAVAVSDTGAGRIVTFRMAPEGAQPVAEYKLAEVPYPTRMEFTSKGDLLVLDGKSRRIARVSSSGAFRGFVELPAAGAPAVRSFAVDRQDQLFVLDVSVPRVIVLDAAGKLAREIALPAGRTFFSDLALDPRGNLYLIDSLGQQAWVVRTGTTEAAPFGGSLAQELEFATSLAAADSGHLFVVDQYGDGIVILGPDGSFQGRQGTMGVREGFLRFPSAVAYDPAGTLLVADRDNNRVQVFAIAR
ncbi:MAG: NHL repeat-containing protein [Acidobacteria bacterium]|nr:NHL repeat-containing protein [Acidobacteriota bacterium]